MLDVQKLWIGDEIYVKSLNKNGYFEGIINANSVKVKIQGQNYVIDIKDIEEAKPVEEQESFILPPEPDQFSKEYGNTIDLHIEVLNPTMFNTAPQLILNHQMKMCKEFIEHAISKNKTIILIVHGLGEGVLKSEVQHLLKNYDEVKFTLEKNNGGATEVWIDALSSI